MSMDKFWEDMAAAGPQTVLAGGTELRRGSRVRLKPRPGGDVFDLVLAGRVAIVEGIDQDEAGNLHVAVTLEDDPGRDLGEARQPGHRFFFSVDEVEPLASEVFCAGRRVLVAGIGNVFLGDDGFGVAVARLLLQERRLPPGVDVADFGIRGLDLAYALQERYDAAILVDACPRGEPPGTLSVIEPQVDQDEAIVLDTHGMDPVKVLRLARALGGVPPRTVVVGCEPASVVRAERDEDLAMELSPAVRAAVEPAARLVEELVGGLLAEDPAQP